jgi:hypothetical protein
VREDRIPLTASICVLAMTTMGCGPVLHDGIRAGQKYEIAETSVDGYGNDVKLVHMQGWWFTNAGTGRPLTLFDVRNDNTVDLCVDMILNLVGDENNIGVWFPVEHFLLRAGQTRSQVAGFASDNDTPSGSLEADVTSWKAAADPSCKNEPPVSE